MRAINYSAKVLPDGHLSLPEEIIEKMGLAINSTVDVTLRINTRRRRAIKAFGAWAERTEIRDGAEYVSKIRTEWDKRAETINDV